MFEDKRECDGDVAVQLARRIHQTGQSTHIPRGHQQGHGRGDRDRAVRERVGQLERRDPQHGQGEATPGQSQVQSSAALARLA